MLKAKIFVVFIATLFFHSHIYGQEWLFKIVPLETQVSHIEEISRITPKVVRDDKLLYKLKEGNLFVGLSLGRCVNTTWGNWNVGKGTITDIVFYPKKGRKPSHYNLRKEGMKQGFDNGHLTYTNDEIGLYYSTEFRKVTRLHLYPAKKNDNLNCDNPKGSQNQ